MSAHAAGRPGGAGALARCSCCPSEPPVLANQEPASSALPPSPPRRMAASRSARDSDSPPQQGENVAAQEIQVRLAGSQADGLGEVLERGFGRRRVPPGASGRGTAAPCHRRGLNWRASSSTASARSASPGRRQADGLVEERGGIGNRRAAFSPGQVEIGPPRPGTGTQCRARRRTPQLPRISLLASGRLANTTASARGCPAPLARAGGPVFHQRLHVLIVPASGHDFTLPFPGDYAGRRA